MATSFSALAWRLRAAAFFFTAPFPVCWAFIEGVAQLVEKP